MNYNIDRTSVLLSFLILIFLPPSVLNAQNYIESIKEYRKHYRDKFLNGSKSLLKEDDLQYLRFYEPNSLYQVKGTFELTLDAKEFSMPTYSGLQRPYIQYGVITFSLDGKIMMLNVYQNLMLKDNPDFIDYLFIPFKDKTNGTTTYGGGRYLELRMGEIVDNKVVMDFNKCYNPYCAYSEGFNCPIPPIENHLTVKIEAGEKMFAKTH